MKAGLELVMAGHIVYPNIKPPRGISSLSRFFVGTLLRHDLGYDGVVITDALNAGALVGLSPQAVALGAIRAGDDLLLERTTERPIWSRPMRPSSTLCRRATSECPG